MFPPSVVPVSSTTSTFAPINDPLSVIIDSDNVQKISQLLLSDPTVYTYKDKYGRSLIVQAIVHKKWEITKYLLHKDRSSQINLLRKTETNRTVLHYACETSWEHSEEVLRTLLIRELNPFEIDMDETSPVMLLMNTNEDLVPVLLMNNKVAPTAEQLFCAMAYAIRNRAEKSFFKLLLLSNSLSLNYQEKTSGNSLLHYAAEYQNQSAVELLLLQGIDVNLLNNSELSALAPAYQNNNQCICKLLLQKNPLCNRGKTVSHIYAARGSQAIQALLEAQVLSIQDSSVSELCSADNSLHALLPSTPQLSPRNVTWISRVISTAASDAPKVQGISLSALLQHKSYVQIVSADPESNTYLHYMTTTDGVTSKDLGAIEPMNWSQLRNKVDEPPLHFCIRTGKINHVRCLLLVKNAIVTDGNSNTALHHAVKHKELFTSILMAHLPTLINMKNIDGMTPLHIAALHGQAIAVQHLLQYGSPADPEAVDHQCNSPLQLLSYAKVNNDTTTLIAQQLVQKMTNVLGTNRQGENALHCAVRHKRPQLVTWLLHNTALATAINNPNDKKETPLTTACQNNDEAMVKLLVTHNALRYDPQAVIAACRVNNAGILSLFMTKHLTLDGRKISCRHADPNAVLQIGQNQSSPLIEAVKHKANACVQYLLKHGAKPHKIPSKDSILKIAIEANAVDTIPILLLHKKVKITQEDYQLAAATNDSIRQKFDLIINPKQRGRSSSQGSGAQSRSRSNSASRRALETVTSSSSQMLDAVANSLRRLSFSRSNSSTNLASQTDTAYSQNPLTG